jgi:hypothetical protein
MPNRGAPLDRLEMVTLCSLISVAVWATAELRKRCWCSQRWKADCISCDTPLTHTPPTQVKTFREVSTGAEGWEKRKDRRVNNHHTTQWIKSRQSSSAHCRRASLAKVDSGIENILKKGATDGEKNGRLFRSMQTKLSVFSVSAVAMFP